MEQRLLSTRYRMFGKLFNNEAWFCDAQSLLLRLKAYFY